ncbi:GntR family transcriptional regulator [Runella rosea]|uniref:GntR family transcriptional regulator n=1 Tax=Runella rosea TaxID=2259595 RepID=A0A344TM95_9BACT|nr:GntR family transcriptional regulator [Runella rosea]AXE19766.1 GntR family transcriptional regulator [Runella rosea]
MTTTIASISRRRGHHFGIDHSQSAAALYQLQFNPSDKMPKYKQIVHSVIKDIERGVLQKGDQLPSISELSIEYLLARDTVEKAYRELRARGYITSVQGKGYYIQSNHDKKLKVLLIFNKLSSYKKIIYYSFLKTLGDKATVDLEIHHYSAGRFQEIIDKNLGKYNYYIVMPHFTEDLDKADYLQTLKSIPANELVLLDREIPELPQQPLSIYQRFDKDIFEALENATDLLSKYQRMVLIFPSDGNYPLEIVRGFRNFCINYHKEFEVRENSDESVIETGTAYIAVEENDLAELIKKARHGQLTLGNDIGVISFNETALKELLDITVITTDFELMGQTAATLLINNQRVKVKNPFYMIRRGSL